MGYWGLSGPGLKGASMPSNFNIFDPTQWVDASGFVVVVVIAVLTIVGVSLKLVTTGWSDWLDESHGRGSIEDPWEE